MLGLRFCARAFSSCGKWGPLFIVVRGPLIIAASLVAGHRLQTRRLSSCGSQDQSLRGMWDFPRPGLEPVSPALAGRFSTTARRKKHFQPFLSLLLVLVITIIIDESTSIDLLSMMVNFIHLHSPPHYPMSSTRAGNVPVSTTDMLSAASQDPEGCWHVEGI